MNRKFRILILALITAVTCGYSFHRKWTLRHHSTTITVVLSSDTPPDMYQIFFDTGNGFHEGESIKLFYEAGKRNQLDFTLPRKRFTGFRIDPGTQESLIKINQIRMTHGKTEVSWKGEDLIRLFTPIHHVTQATLSDGDLLLFISGNDPYLHFNGDIEQFIDFRIDWAGLVLFMVQTALFLTLTSFLVLYCNQARNPPGKTGGLFEFFHKITPGKLFLAVSLQWGLIMVFVTPPFQVPDEASHFYRSYQVSRGDFSPVVKNNQLGGYIPRSISRYLSGYTHIPFHKDEKTSLSKILSDFKTDLAADRQIFVQHINSAQYTPFLYAPQSIGMFLPRNLNASPPIILYAGRIGNLLLWVLLIHMAISITPIFKWIFFLLAVLPMSVSQAASLSPDSMINGMSFLLIAKVLNMAFGVVRSISKRDIFITLMLLFYLTIAKNVYFYLGALVFLIPKERFATRRYRGILYAGVCFSVAAAVLVNMLYLRLVKNGLDMSGGVYASYPGYPQDIYPFQQLMHVLSDLPGYFLMLLNYFTNHLMITIKGCIGILGWFDTYLPLTFYIFVIFILIITALFDKNETVDLKVRHKFLLFSAVMASFVTILSVLYLVWMPLGAKEFDIIQGRYLIPLAPVFMLLFYNRRLNMPNGFLPLVSSVTASIFFIVTLTSVVLRYYV